MRGAGPRCRFPSRPPFPSSKEIDIIVDIEPTFSREAWSFLDVSQEACTADAPAP